MCPPPTPPPSLVVMGAESAVLLGDTLRPVDGCVSGGPTGFLLRLCTPATPPLQRVALIKVPKEPANKAPAEWGKKGRDCVEAE